MSAIFRSAAMTLLSKTLQTLLYKYLSDVDVEGVALPSLLYNSSDGHSGWGVRLSNVKLREGAKLLDLPGTTRRKRRKRGVKLQKKKRRTKQRSPRKEHHHPKNETKSAANERGNENNRSNAKMDASFSALSLNEHVNESSNDSKKGGYGRCGESFSSLTVQQQQEHHNSRSSSQLLLLGNMSQSHNSININDDDHLDEDDPEVRAAARAAALAAAYNASNEASSSMSKRKGWFGSWYSSSSSSAVAAAAEATHLQHPLQTEAAICGEEDVPNNNNEAVLSRENGIAEVEKDDEAEQSSSSDGQTLVQQQASTVDAVEDETPNNYTNQQQQQPQASFMADDASVPPTLQTTNDYAAAAASSASSSPRRRSWFGYFYSSIGPLENEQQAPLSQSPLQANQADHGNDESPITDMHSSVASGLSLEPQLATTPLRGNVTKTRAQASAQASVDGEDTLAQQPDEEVSTSSSSLSYPLLFETPKRKTSATISTTSSACTPPRKSNSSKTRGLVVDDAATIKEGDEENGDLDEDDDYSYAYDDEDGDDDDDDDENAYEDFFEEVVAPMILRLGPAGRIGTLDIRLVGKDIHVLVEDADLLVEVVRPPPKKEEDTNNKAQGGGGSGEASFSSPENKTAKGTEKKKPAAAPIPEPKTVGDRVMAENTIARAFSAIPNLLLRDIRVRLVVRDEEEPQDGDHQRGAIPGRSSDDAAELPESQQSFQGEKSPSSASSGTSSTKPAASSSETVFEVCIELMSVTADGQDFFAHFRRDNDLDDSSEAMDAEEDEMDESRNVVSTSALDGDNQTIQENEYLTKRIRTGRGPDGGITIRAFPGGISDHFVSASRDDEWSRYSWLSLTEFCVLRCSGLDVYARMFMGTRKEVRHSTSSLFWYSNDEYDADFSVDSMLFGVDYIAPGPQPPLPPIDEQTDLGAEDEGQLWMIPGATTYQIDANGIQSSRVGSSFHRVARGMTPTICRSDHLPCEYCPKCWDAVPGTCLEHQLDDSAPMGGLVLNVSIRDRLEFNVDRPCLESIGLLLSLFIKKDASEEEEVKTESAAEEDIDVESITGLDMSENSAGARSLSSRNSMKARQLRRSSKSGSSAADPGSGPMRRSGSKSGSFAGDIERAPPPKPNAAVDHIAPDEVVDAEETGKVGDDITNSFPSYMQPEKIQYIGVNVSEVVFRVHVMRERTVEDHRLSFMFWSILVKCLTVDHQQLVSPGRSFQDIRCDFGHFSADEYRGVERKQLASLGLRQRVVDFDEITVETLMTRETGCQRPPWPSTASVLLDLPPPVESLLYETRDRHAIQIRFVSTLEAGVTSDFSRSSVHIKLGATFMDVPSNIGSQISTVISEAKKAATGPPRSINASPDAEKLEVKENVDSLMKYKIQLDGARVSLQQLVDVRLPLTTLVGERSSTAGISFQTALEHLNLKYGNTATPSLFTERRLSLEHLAEIPENVRLRILLFLDNLNPLARAFGIKMEEENSFLLCGAINKAIIKLSRKARRKSQTAGGEDPEGISRRQEIMSELLRLDDDDLEDLWETHRRNQRRSARQKSNSKF